MLFPNHRSDNCRNLESFLFLKNQFKLKTRSTTSNWNSVWSITNGGQNPPEPIKTHQNPLKSHQNPSEPIRTHQNPPEHRLSRIFPKTYHCLIGAVEQAILQQIRRPVRNQGIPLHLAESRAPSAFPPLDRLSRELIHRARRPHLILIRDHVPQTLVIDQPEENAHVQLAPVHSAVHSLRAEVVVALLLQHLPEMTDGHVVFPVDEGSGVERDPGERGHFPRHGLDHHADGHARRVAVGVEDDVGDHAGLGEGHVFHGVETTAHAFLAVSAGELVTHCWRTL